MLAPMARGIRLTTGAEFALRDAPPTPGAARARRAAGAARSFRSASASTPDPGWGAAVPARHAADHRPGAAPRGLWFDFGHHHLGFTLGPVAGGCWPR